MKPERVYGVDFSGAEDAGKKIWIAGGEVSSTTLKLETCQRVSTLPGSSTKRDQALAALRKFMTQRAPCVVGLDFPFGLPGVLVDEQRWADFARSFGTRFPNAESMKEVCTARAIEEEGVKELRRVTDNAAGTPFSPYNLRLYKQTYYGIRDVLAPLAATGAASVLPMQPAVSGRAWLVEICPASTLKRMGLGMPFKGAAFAKARKLLLDKLIESEHLVVPKWMQDTVISDQEGDALDSIIAADATFRALRESIGDGDLVESGLVEGRVYV